MCVALDFDRRPVFIPVAGVMWRPLFSQLLQLRTTKCFPYPAASGDRCRDQRNSDKLPDPTWTQHKANVVILVLTATQRNRHYDAH